jgi:hypothetical protein
MSGDEINAVTAIATAILAAVALVQFWVFSWFSAKQRHDTREAVDRTIEAQRRVALDEIAVHLYLDMKARWDSDRTLKSRKALAYHYIGSTARNAAFFEAMQEDVPNFFEDLGSLLKRGLVNEELTYSFISYYVNGWYSVCRPYIEWLQKKKKDNSLFADFKFLADRMMALEAAERKIPADHAALNDAEINEFLNEDYIVIG